jgi:hyaluronoglucosaminidase
MNTYVYGPKADLYHRRSWSTPYPRSTMKEFAELCKKAQACGVGFNYALSPLSQPEPTAVVRKLAAMLDTGITQFSLFFDDIKVKLNEKTAVIQIETVVRVLDYLKTQISRPILFFCPTQYRGFKRSEYIHAIADHLPRSVRVFWTGKRVVSKRITKKDLERISLILKRPILIWDNLFANDYVPGIIWRFPYRYRTPLLLDLSDGVLLNPMNQYKASKPLIYTAGLFFKNPHAYVPGKAWKHTRALGL